MKILLIIYLIYDTNVVSYTGEWGFGVPNGKGELYVENYLGDWDMTYMGQMKNGLRDGVGSWYEYYDNEYQSPKFRIYGEAVYSENRLTEWTDCVEYFAETGEIYQYCKMITDDAGNPLMGDTWGPNDLSPEEEYALGVATAAVTLGMVAYLVDTAFTNDYDYERAKQNQLNELNSWRENKAAEEQANMERELKEKENYRLYCCDKYDELYSKGLEGSLDGQYFRYNGYGY